MILVGELLTKNIYVSLIAVSVIAASLTFFVVSTALGAKCSKEQGNTVNSIEFSNTPESSDSVTTHANNIKVDLSGAVVHPGVYTLPSDARVADLIKEGGGFDDVASEIWVAKNINLAAKLSDSQKIYVPFDWDINNTVGLAADADMTYEDAISYLDKQVSKVSDNADIKGTTADDSSSLVNINTGTSSELDTLPGVGQVYAQKIISNRPYKDASELNTKSGIPMSTIEKFISLIKF
jgi:competence protein ComEA